MESASVAAPAPAEGAETGEKGLKKDAIGFLDGLSIGLASTAPAYSLAAVVGSIVVAVGIHAPGVLLLSFVPMFFIAAAFYYMNRVDTDCGTTFSWVTRALGPYAGFMGGWAICTTGILVVGSLADVSAFYIFDLLELNELRRSEVAVAALSVLIIVVMTTICVIGTELSAHLQRILTLGQVGILLLFAGAVFGRLIFDKVPERSISPELSWLSPFGVEYSALLTGVLLAVFIYWGWESAVNLSEETEDSSRAPGLAGLASTVILLVTYVAVAVAVVAYAGLGLVEKFDDNAGILGNVSHDVLGNELGKLVVIAVIISGISSAQTTILPGSRTSLSMAAAGALPKAFAHIHPRFLTPDFGTIVVGGLAILWYVPGKLISENFLFDSLSALSLMIAFYYGLTGLACAIYWRHELWSAVKDFAEAATTRGKGGQLLVSLKEVTFIGVAPVVGAGLLFYLLFESARDLADPKLSYSGTEFLGMGVPLAIAVVFIAIGLLIMVGWRLFGPAEGREFFRRRPFEAVPHEVATGEVSQVEAIGVSEAAADAGAGGTR
jgi:amino acid transporter